MQSTLNESVQAPFTTFEIRPEHNVSERITLAKANLIVKAPRNPIFYGSQDTFTRNFN